MMRKIFLLLFCLILLPPAWASEQLFGEISNDDQPNFAQEQLQELPQEPQEEISLFSQDETDSNTNPYSVYTGAKKMVLKGGLRFNEEKEPTTILSKDRTLLTITPRKKGFGKFLIGESKSVNDSIGGFFGYHKGRFSLTHSFERVEFRPELARSNSAIEPELQLNKNLKFKTSFRGVQGQKGYTQGVALEYGKTDSRFKKVNNLKFKVKASTSITPDSEPVKRFGFNTKYYF